MPLPRYIANNNKRTKVSDSNRPSLNDLDDYCLSKIISHVLLLTSSRGSDNDDSLIRDNSRIVRNFSLVSKRWYFLTQSQVTNFGVCRIDLNRIIKGRSLYDGIKPPLVKLNKLLMSPRTPGILNQRNILLSRSPHPSTVSNLKRLKPQQQQPVDNNMSTIISYNICLFLKIQPILLKYKHIILDGNLKCDEFYKLIIALDSSRIEHVQLNIRIERDHTKSKEFGLMPRQLTHLDSLTLIWSNNIDLLFGNLLTWSIYMRACNLRSLRVTLIEDPYSDRLDLQDLDKINTIERVANMFIGKIPITKHNHLNKIVFNRTMAPQSTPITSNNNIVGGYYQEVCKYTLLMKNIFAKEPNLNQVETNDNSLIEHLIKSSDRVCTTNQLRVLKFSSPVSGDLLLKLLETRNLGTDHLSIIIDNTNRLDDIRQALQEFKRIRHQDAICQVCLFLNDQKFSDCEDKIKNLIHLSRLTELVVYIHAIQRVTIDCCHLMWSVGRVLQSPICSSAPPSASANVPDSTTTGKCVFKVIVKPTCSFKHLVQHQILQQQPLDNNLLLNNNCIEITIPFGSFQNYKINSNREDSVKHREILKALKKDCYNQFVKSVRDIVAP